MAVSGGDAWDSNTHSVTTGGPVRRQGHASEDGMAEMGKLWILQNIMAEPSYFWTFSFVGYIFLLFKPVSVTVFHHMLLKTP